MPKNKNHKGLLKRIRISKTGKVRHRSANHKHLRSGKGGKALRHLRKDPYVSGPDAKRWEKYLFRRLRGRNQPLAARKVSPSPAASAKLKAAKAEAAKGGTVKRARPSFVGTKAKGGAQGGTKGGAKSTAKAGK
jgi:large subunit ribosomal protein L35